MERSDKETLLELLQEKDNRKTEDPFRAFVPTPKQKAFIDCTLPEAWAITANRWGKSQALALIAARAFREGMEAMHPAMLSGGDMIWDRAANIWVSSLDFGHSREVLQPYLFDNGFVPPGIQPLIPNREIKRWYKDERQTLIGKYGSLMSFKSAESGRLKYSGAGKDLAVIDEEHPKDIIDEIIIRVPAGKKLFLRGGATLLPPEGNVGGVTWIYPEIIQPWLRGEKRETVALFGGSIWDNPHISREEIARLESKYPPGSVEARIRLGGEWLPGLGGSRAYTPFSSLIHVNKDVELLQNWPLCWSLDFNVDPMISTIGQLIPVEGGKKKFRFIDEIVLEGGATPMDAADEFQRRYRTHSAEIWVYGDSTGHNRGQNNKSSYTMIMESFRTYPGVVRLKIPEKNPFVTDRINAFNVALKGIDGFIGVEVHPRCVELIGDLEQVQREARPPYGIKKATYRKDPYFRRTHASDGAGYWIVFEAPVGRSNIASKYVPKITPPGYAWTTA